MNYHEKSAWVCAICILAVYAPYFVFVWFQPEFYFALFIAATVGIIVLMAGFHSAIALSTRNVLESGDTPPRDEMDQAIESRAAKISGVLLGAFVMLWCFNAFILIPANAFEVNEKVVDDPSLIQTMTLPMGKVVFAVHVLFAGFVISNLVYYGSIIFGYRRLGW